MYSALITLSLVSGPVTADSHRSGCSGVSAARAGCTGRAVQTVAIPVQSASCHGNAQITRQRVRTVTHTRTASVALPAPAAPTAPAIAPVAPPPPPVASIPSPPPFVPVPQTAPVPMQAGGMAFFVDRPGIVGRGLFRGVRGAICGAGGCR